MNQQLELFTEEKNPYTGLPFDELEKTFYNLFGFKCPVDGLMSAVLKKKVIDILKLDEKLQQANPEYNSERCTYKDQKEISMAMFIKLRYGEKAHQLIKVML